LPQVRLGGRQGFLVLVPLVRRRIETLKVEIRMRSLISAKFYFESDLAEPVLSAVGRGEACVYTAPCPGREGPNEDAALVIAIDGNRCVLALADGFGGHPAAARAAATALSGIESAVSVRSEGDEGMVAAVVAGFEEANRAVRAWGVGAATTLSLVVVDGSRARSFHVGDSEILVTGQRGKVKLRTVSHSPVGYAVESGFLDEKEALNHADRHVVSNMVGSEEMHIELGPVVNLAPRDTLLLGSDGLWDNLRFEEVVGRIRKGGLVAAVADLTRLCRDRMISPGAGEPSKPDDLTLVAFRLR
jgi:serine/threonine protein phosphatase PrpC